MEPAIVIHGGASDREPDAAAAARAEEGLRAAAEAGHRMLAAGEAALVAARAAVLVLEDHPSFNAGRGAVRCSDGSIELSAAVMCGRTGDAGAVAAVRRVRNPVEAAHAVLERSPHVGLVGPAADEFALAHGAQEAGPGWFAPERRDGVADPPHGTVGAVALDVHGALAAATSTGGTRGQLRGRLSDTPVIGAGTYADTRCAVSCTGIGEAFIKAVAAFNLAARLRAGADLEAAAATVVHDDVGAAGGTGGLVAITSDGTVAMPFSTRAMYRAWSVGAEIRVAIGPA